MPRSMDDWHILAVNKRVDQTTTYVPPADKLRKIGFVLVALGLRLSFRFGQGRAHDLLYI